MFDSAGYKASFDEDGFKGGSVVINTCGFIGDAKEESVNMIIEAINAKSEGFVDKVFVMGCLAERYSAELPAELPEVDGWYGKFDWTKIINDLAVSVPKDLPAWERILSTPSHHAYVKIAEGCNRFCAFCAIPLITGRYHSRPIDEILDEVTSLVARGVSEFNILAQDLSYYGHDIYGHSALAELIDRMAGLNGVHRIRLHYAYPADFPYDILPVMAKHKNVCKYLDIALQHISDKVPGIHIRTTLMVGFPGEGEAEFEELKKFVREQRFERMGAFAYCEEEDTYAAQHFEDSIPEDVKQQRLDEIMAIQEEIALSNSRSKIDKTLEVVIDSENDDYYVGRTEFDSPEVDPEVLISKTKKLKIGEYYNVKITSAETFELFGIPV
jgi:ribosomal protein S12 methylthiotransferase